LRALDNDRIGVQRYGNRSRYADGGLLEAIEVIEGLVDSAAESGAVPDPLSVGQAVDQASQRAAREAEDEHVRRERAARERLEEQDRAHRVARLTNAFLWLMRENDEPGITTAVVLNDSLRAVGKTRGWIVGTRPNSTATGWQGGSREEHHPLFLTEFGELYVATADAHPHEASAEAARRGAPLSLKRDAQPVQAPFEGQFGTIDDPSAKLPADEALVRGIGELLAHLGIPWTEAAEARLEGEHPADEDKGIRRESLAPNRALGDVPELLRNLAPLIYGVLPLGAVFLRSLDATGVAVGYALAMAPLFNYVLYTDSDRGFGGLALGAAVTPGLALGVYSGSAAAIYIALAHAAGGALYTSGAWGPQAVAIHGNKRETWGESVLMMVGLFGGVAGWLLFAIK